MKSERATVGNTTREVYKHWTEVELRYGDTDRQGHINNAVYCTLFESGRVSFLFNRSGSIAKPGKSFVIAKLTLDFLFEMNFPGRAEIGSRVIAVGTSSFTVGQAIFKDGVCCSTSESVIVHTDDATRRSSPLDPELVEFLNRLS